MVQQNPSIDLEHYSVLLIVAMNFSAISALLALLALKFIAGLGNAHYSTVTLA